MAPILIKRINTIMVDAAEEEDAATSNSSSSSSSTHKDVATSSSSNSINKAVEEVAADTTTIIRAAVSVEEAVAMISTFRVVMRVPLQLTRLDSQDGSQDGIIIIIMIRDHTTLIRDGIDNQLSR